MRNKGAHRWSLLLMAAALAIVSGCGGAGSSSGSGAPAGNNAASAPAPNAPAAAKDPVTVTIWVGSWWQDIIPKITEAFEKEHPGIKLKMEALPINGYLEKAIAASLGGNAPDLLDLDATMIASMAGRDMLETWDDEIKTLDSADFNAGIWKSSMLNGKMYALPHRGGSQVYVYNKTMFDAAGVPYPTENWTHRDMLEMAQKITVPGQKYGIGIAASSSDPSNVMTSFAPVLWAHGGDFLNSSNTEAVINSPESVQGIAFWAELHTKHKVTPDGSVSFTLTKDVVPMFVNNQIALMPGNSNTVDELKKHPDLKWGTQLAPDKVGRGGGWAFTLPTGAKHKEEARTFAMWFIRPENLGKLANREPARISATNVAPWNTPEYQILFKAAPYQKLLPTVANWSELQNIVITGLQKVLTGNKTPQQAADEMAAQMNALLKK